MARGARGAVRLARHAAKVASSKAGGSALAAIGPILLVVLVVLILVIIVIAIMAAIFMTFSSPFHGYEYEGMEGIMAEYYHIYMQAEQEYGIPWYILAGVHKVESDFGRNKNDSHAGATGHMQFMPCTWLGWGYPGCRGTSGNPAGGIPQHQLTDPDLIKRYGGLGIDANGDGKADPWDPYDAIFTAASYLKSLGFENDPQGALSAYNAGSRNSEAGLAYAERVMGHANVFLAGTGDLEGIPAFVDGVIGQFPVAGKVDISSPFGRRTDPKTGEPGRMHHGVDFAVPVGTPVHVPVDGKVVRAGCDRQGCDKGYGRLVEVKHDGYYTVYAHLAHIAVKKGQKVKAGEMIALSGNSGKSTGPHLHWEVRLGRNSTSSTVDPLQYFGLGEG